MNGPRYRYEIEYFVTDDSTGKHKRKKEVEFTKPKEQWDNAEWDTLDRYLRLQEKSSRCDVSVIEVKPIRQES